MVDFKDGDRYREPEANNRKSVGFYFQVGVREIDQVAFDEICRAGLPQRGRHGSVKPTGGAGYATPEVAAD